MHSLIILVLMSNMLTDPLFLLGSFGMTMSVISWIKFNLDENNDEPFLIKYLSFISLSLIHI